MTDCWDGVHGWEFKTARLLLLLLLLLWVSEYAWDVASNADEECVVKRGWSRSLAFFRLLPAASRSLGYEVFMLLLFKLLSPPCRSNMFSAACYAWPSNGESGSDMCEGGLKRGYSVHSVILIECNECKEKLKAKGQGENERMSHDNLRRVRVG